MSKYLLEVQSASVMYPGMDAPALDGASILLSRGELVAVVGHNGAGKSTLFDVIGGLRRPQMGTVNLSIPRSEVGWCPQREIIDWSLTVEQNIELGYELRSSVNRRDRKRNVLEVCAALGLERHRRRTAETLSGGELRRTQIARAIVGKPSLMILDEPTTGLDPEGIGSVFGFLEEQRDLGHTAIISTHETSRFGRFCTRVVAIVNGRIVADEPRDAFLGRSSGSDDLWDSYKTLIVDGAGRGI